MDRAIGDDVRSEDPYDQRNGQRRGARSPTDSGFRGIMTGRKGTGVAWATSPRSAHRAAASLGRNLRDRVADDVPGALAAMMAAVRHRR